MAVAGGDRSHDATPARTAVERAIKSLTDPGALRRGQQGDPFLSKVRSCVLHQERRVNHENQRVRDMYLLDDNDLLWYTPKGKKKVLAVHRALVPDLTSLIHAIHAHPGVASTLALVRERFHWPTMTRDVREYVLSCGCRRRKR